ncbi:MAG: dihydroorotase, partial [Stellaceae bacterium]
MTERILFTNARLLDPASGIDRVGDLLAENGVIAALGPNLARDGLGADVQVVDCAGCCLAPGVIDMRVQLR